MKIFESLQKQFKEGKLVTRLFVFLAVGVTLLVVAQFVLEPDNTDLPQNYSQRYSPRYSYEPQFSIIRPDIEIRLEEILSLVEGAGETRVLVHFAQGPESVFARNETIEESYMAEKDSAGGTREQSQTRSTSSIVTINRREGGDEPLRLFENAPRIEGVIIVAQGGANIIVRDALTRAASGLLGVPIHKITVLPMAINQ